MLAHELEIFRATRQLNVELLAYTKNVSREVKFLEYAEMRRKVTEALDMIYLINSEVDNEKAAELLRHYIFLLFGVQNRLRLLAETGYLKTGFKTKMIERIDECQKQAVRWKKYKTRSQN